MNKLRDVVIGLTAVASILVGIESAPAALADSDPEIRILEPLGIDGKLGYDGAITITFQLIGGWATSLKSCTDIRDQAHVPIIGLAAVDANGEGVNYEGLGGTIVHQAYYRRNFSGAPISNGFQCTGTFEWGYKPGDVYNLWGETGFSVPGNSLSWSTGTLRSTDDIFRNFFDARWGASDFQKGLGKITRVSLAYAFLDKTTYVNITPTKRIDFQAISDSEMKALQKTAADKAAAAKAVADKAAAAKAAADKAAADKAAADKAAAMTFSLKNGSNKSSITFVPTESKKGVSVGTFSGTLSFINGNRPAAEETVDICVSGHNPFTDEYTERACSAVKTNSSGLFSTKIQLPQTYEVSFEVSPESLINGYMLENESDAKLAWTNKTYLSQHNARVAADKKAAAAQAAADKKAAAAQAAAKRNASSNAYKQAYSAVMNATTSLLESLRFYNYLSPGGGMTNQNARSWCNSIRAYDMLWVSWIDGCAKAAQIQARR